MSVNYFSLCQHNHFIHQQGVHIRQSWILFMFYIFIKVSRYRKTKNVGLKYVIDHNSIYTDLNNSWTKVSRKFYFLLII